MSDKHKALAKPATISADDQAQEFIRFWIANNTDHVSLKVGTAGDPAKEPAMWGFILADIAKHVTKVMRQQDPEGPSANELMEQILGGIAERLRHAPELSGSSSEVKS